MHLRVQAEQLLDQLLLMERSKVFGLTWKILLSIQVSIKVERLIKLFRSTVVQVKTPLVQKNLKQIGVPILQLSLIHI